MQFFNYILQFSIVKVLVITIALDTIFGILRAIREKKINSTLGIDGMIRKVGMVISIVFFYLIDYIMELNFISFLPESLLEYLPIKELGIGFLFNTLFIVFESLSILKNMIKCKLPIPKKLQNFLEKVFSEFTDELKEKKKWLKE